MSFCYLQCTDIARIIIFCRRRSKDNVMYNFGTVGSGMAYSCFSNVSCAIEAGRGPVSLLLCSHLPYISYWTIIAPYTHSAIRPSALPHSPIHSSSHHTHTQPQGTPSTPHSTTPQPHSTFPPRPKLLPVYTPSGMRLRCIYIHGMAWG